MPGEKNLARIVRTSDYGPLKAGSTISHIPFSLTPEIGKVPVEIMDPESPLGSKGRGVHISAAPVSRIQMVRK